MRAILLLLLIYIQVSAETLQEVFQRVPSWNRVTIMAPDGTFLGNLDPSQVAPLSVFNPVGLHGSTVGPQSVRNQFGMFGGEYGLYSPSNPHCINPPILLVDGIPIAHITSNPYSIKRPVLSLLTVLSLPMTFPKP